MNFSGGLLIDSMIVMCSSGLVDRLTDQIEKSEALQMVSKSYHTNNIHELIN